jgi:hypothetical protein
MSSFFGYNDDIYSPFYPVKNEQERINEDEWMYMNKEK